MNESIKLWGAGTARTLRPIWMAEELEINYELIPIVLELRNASIYSDKSKAKNTSYGVKELKLSESLTICRYFQKLFRENFHPKG